MTDPAAAVRYDTPVAVAAGTLATVSCAAAPTPRHDGDLPLRLAQRAFAALLDQAARNHASTPALRGAHLRSAARRTLSTLSADDRSRLVRWLALQIASAGADTLDSPLARIDALLASRVAAILARTREELAPQRRDTGIAAA